LLVWGEIASGSLHVELPMWVKCYNGLVCTVGSALSCKPRVTERKAKRARIS
jgi:hypothetical protein